MKCYLFLYLYRKTRAVYVLITDLRNLHSGQVKYLRTSKTINVPPTYIQLYVNYTLHNNLILCQNKRKHQNEAKKEWQYEKTKPISGRQACDLETTDVDKLASKTTLKVSKLFS